MRYCCLSLQKPAAGLKVAIRLADQALLGALQAHERLRACLGQRYSAQVSNHASTPGSQNQTHSQDNAA